MQCAAWAGLERLLPLRSRDLCGEVCGCVGSRLEVASLTPATLQRRVLSMTETMRLQERVRADRHGTSYPLIVVGAVGFHYASTGLFGWISVIYGIPLAFVIVWLLQRRTEKLDGVGMGNDDVLLIAFGVSWRRIRSHHRRG